VRREFLSSVVAGRTCSGRVANTYVQGTPKGVGAPGQRGEFNTRLRAASQLIWGGADGPKISALF
jgi:hypothetical protein